MANKKKDTKEMYEIIGLGVMVKKKGERTVEPNIERQTLASGGGGVEKMEG